MLRKADTQSTPMSSVGQQVQQEQQSQQIQPQQRRRQRSGRAPKHPSSRTYTQSNRRIYDVRTWHRRKSIDKMGGMDWGQPPAGWVLVWAGRFKRWRRRWFLAHPAGLLLYYKNSEQLGRPGCISLQGAEVSPMAGKERQFKIRRGTIVYYLRTLNKENRQAWLETIQRCIGTYQRSWQKVDVGSKSGKSLALQQSVPEHLAEEWKQQETEVNCRLAEKMRELEPIRQAFLQQVQGVQQSLSVLSEAFGFKNSSTTRVETSPPLGPREPARPSFSPPLYPYSNGKSPAVKSQGGRKGGLISSLSDPIPHLEINEAILDEQTSNRQQYCVEEDCSEIPDHKQASCIGRELFRLKRKEINGSNSVEKGHSSDTEVCSASGTKKPVSGKDGNGRTKHEHAKLPTSLSVDSFPFIPADGSPDKTSNGGVKNDLDVTNSNSQKGHNSHVQKAILHCHSPLVMSPSLDGHPTQGQLHAAWNTMQDTFAEILKEEIRRVVELEAENTALQQSLSMLPQLQQDHRDLLDLKERMQTHKPRRTEDRYMDGEFGDDEDTDEEVSLAPSDVTNEDYYEALEVLNQHEFIAKSTSPEELEILGERAEYSQEPPEEGDLSNDTENCSEVEGDEYEQPRIRLPAPRPLQRGFSLWSVLKNAIGKDLNHITMPATINEPLSVLQRCAEELQYSHLLEKASQVDDSIERLVWVSMFACATYHGSPHRDAKPFNPLLGETYEWQALDGKLRFIAEQVSHHPPILAFNCHNLSCDYTIYGEVEIKNRFWGKSVEVFPSGRVHLRIPKFGDHITWSKITTCIHNVVVGKLWIDNYGELLIRNHTTGEASHIRFYKATSKEQGRLTGKVFDNKGIPMCSIHGNYMKEISVIPEPCWTRKDAYGESKCLWKHPAPPEDYEQQYCFSRFTIGLNELTPELRDALPPTDSRFRPDQRALEDGDLEKATPEKIRLEEKQREASRRRKENGQEWTSMWFQQRVPGVSQVKVAAEGDEEPTWVFNGQYWKARERQDWRTCPDIM
eukprot:c12805_g1_i1 orf=179-3232(+)